MMLQGRFDAYIPNDCLQAHSSRSDNQSNRVEGIPMIYDNATIYAYRGG